MHPSAETHIKARRYGVVEITPSGDAIRVSASCFLEYISPPLHPSINVEKIIGSFTSGVKRSRKVITGRNRWRGFAQDPAQLGDREQSYFRPLEDLLTAIAKATGMHSSVQLKTNPQGGVLRPYRDANSLPDAYLVLDSSSGRRPGWMDIVVSGEYRNNSTVGDNRFNTEKVLWSMSNMLCRDPRRRFTYGFTIENTDMRLWYCDRSRIIVSEPFNFITEHELFVRFFASFLYARPDRIGWDLTMTRLHAGDIEGLQYDIKVQTHDGEEVIYRTVMLLSDSGAQSLHGRGTRVWKVMRVKDGEAFGDPVVLKDSWVDLDGPREGAILQEICGMAASEPVDKTLSDALLTVECYGDVVIDGDSDRYIDRTTRMNLSELPAHGSDTDAAAIKLLLHCHHKMHHRVVFKEICKTIHQLPSYHDKFRALGQTSIILKALHGFGWVHRDISAGNILIDNAGRARLVDLEYAKKVNDDNVAEIEVGTSKYMAVEVSDQGYHFRPSPDPLPPILKDYTLRATDFDPISDGDSGPSTPSPPTPISPPRPRQPFTPFRYNTIHDFESLWWLATHLVLKIDALYINEKGPPPARSLNQLREQRNWSLFLSYDRIQRLLALTNPPKFQEILCALHPSVKPYGLALDNWRSRITSAHREAQKTPIPDTDEAMLGLYDAFAQDLFTMANALARKTVVTEESEKERLAQLVAAAEVPETSATKRKLDTQIESHEGDRNPGGIDVAIPPRKKARISRPVRTIPVEGPAARTRSRTKANTKSNTNLLCSRLR